MIIVAVIVSLITANLTGGVIAKKIKTINATSCDADNTCEMHNAVIIDDVRAETGGIGTSLTVGSVFIEGKKISTERGSESALILSSDVKKTLVEGSLTITDLLMNLGVVNGTTNAYVCANSIGTFFRSSKPCV